MGNLDCHFTLPPNLEHREGKKKVNVTFKDSDHHTNAMRYMV
jgi:hypothetical protein